MPAVEVPYQEVIASSGRSGAYDGRVSVLDVDTGIWSIEEDIAGPNNRALWDIDHYDTTFAAACIQNDQLNEKGHFWVKEDDIWIDKTSLLPSYISPHSLYCAGVDDVWIGGYKTQSGNSGPILAQYNGSSIVVKYVETLTNTVDGDGVHGTATNNVYLASGRAGFNQGRLVRWNGASSSSIIISDVYDLDSVHAFDTTNIFFGGQHYNGGGGVRHYNGAGMVLGNVTDIGVPVAGVNYRVYGLWANAANDLWACGGLISGAFGRAVWRWNGSTWSQSLYHSGVANGYFWAIDGDKTTGEVWVTGVTTTGTYVIYYWNGSGWTQQTPPAGTDNGRGVSVLSTTQWIYPPTLTPASPANATLNVSRGTNISFTLTHPISITAGWTVDIDTGNGQGWQRAVEHNGSPVFKPGWDGAASAITGVDPSFSITIDPVDNLPYFNTIQVQVTAVEPDEGLEVELP